MTDDDLSDTVLAKSNQLTADDLQGRTLTITITQAVKVGGEQPIRIHYENEQGKPYMPGKSMRRILLKAWGRKLSDFVGRKMTLYRDDKVTWGGLEVGGIRISHMSHITGELVVALTASKSNKKPFTVKPLTETKTVDTSALQAAGAAAAEMGQAAYVAWKDSLMASDKALIKPFHAAWAKRAIDADSPPADI